MLQAIANLMPGKLREKWRDSQLRLQRLERQQKETDMLLDMVLAEAVHSAGCELGMHSQAGRRAVVAELFDKLGLTLAVETGTYLGNTTNYLARTFKVPVHTSELVPRYHHAARRMLRELADVHPRLQDSRGFLRELAAQTEMTSAATFFYLDAHWYNDLPLADEVEIIAKSWSRFAILIDDFKVPGDPDYAFDDYGPRKVLNLDYLKPVLSRNGLKAFFPTTRAKDETGGRAGYAVVLPGSLASVAASSPLLRSDASE